MISSELADSAEADVRRLLDLAKPLPDAPPPEWDAEFVIAFATRVRLELDYQRAVRAFSRLMGLNFFHYPDITADPKDRPPDVSFAAWLDVAESVAFAELREKLPAIPTEVPVVVPAPAREPDARQAAERVDFRSTLAIRVRFAPDGPRAWTSRTAGLTLEPLQLGNEGVPQTDSVRFVSADLWCESVVGRWDAAAGVLRLELPPEAGLSAADIVLRLPNLFVRGQPGSPSGTHSATVPAVFPVPPACEEGSFLILTEVRKLIREELRDPDPDVSVAAVQLIVASGLTEDFRRELRACAEGHPAAAAQVAARSALG